VQSNPDLLEIILALCPSRGFTSLLNGWQQQCYQNGNNGNDDEQFDQSKCPLGASTFCP
jgi:hypothetical protein